MARAQRLLKQVWRQVVANVGRGDVGGRVRRRPGQSRTAPVDSGVRVEYTPQLDGDPDPGEVVWTWVPYEDDPKLGKDRPVVIIGRSGALLTGVALTSKDKVRGDYVDVGTGGWDPKGRGSFAKVDRLLTVDPDAVRREGAILGRRVFDQVVDAVSRRHDLVRA